MTKLLEWISVFLILVTIWLCLIFNTSYLSFDDDEEPAILLMYSPLIILVSFGVIAFVAVLYRTFSFNNCEEAAEKLLEEINEAKISLAYRGYKFP